MSPRIFSPVGTPKILSPPNSRRGSEESPASRRASRTSITMGSSRRRESIIYRNEQEYDSATAVVERKVSSDDAPMDEDFPSTKTSVAPLVTKVRAYSIATLKSRRRAARAAVVMQEQTPTMGSGQRRRSSIVVVHNCSPPSSATREFSEMPEESEDED
ncbi:hypothetical protein ABW20_dc0108094 [Dactylellina cionopaga]|nr:hypothetical protein ABW20_dc0108094 [Dactylellina cionopaga]